MSSLASDKVKGQTVHGSRDSSVGRASDWRSEGHWFDPGSWQSFAILALLSMYDEFWLRSSYSTVSEFIFPDSVIHHMTMPCSQSHDKVKLKVCPSLYFKLDMPTIWQSTPKLHCWKRHSHVVLTAVVSTYPRIHLTTVTWIYMMYLIWRLDQDSIAPV